MPAFLIARQFPCRSSLIPSSHLRKIKISILTAYFSIGPSFFCADGRCNDASFFVPQFSPE